MVTTEFVNKHWLVNTSSRMTLRLISLIPSISARTSYSWISLNLIMFDFEICPVCQKPFTDSVKPKRSCYKYLTTSRDNDHKKFCSDLREMHSEAVKQRMRNLNRQWQQWWWRKMRKEVKSRTEEGESYLLHDNVHLQRKRAEWRKRFTDELKNTTPPIPPSRPKAPLPQLLNPYWVLENIISFVPPQKPAFKSWKQHFESVFQALTNGITIEQVCLSLIYLFYMNRTNLCRPFAMLNCHKNTGLKLNQLHICMNSVLQLRTGWKIILNTLR